MSFPMCRLYTYIISPCNMIWWLCGTQSKSSITSFWNQFNSASYSELTNNEISPKAEKTKQTLHNSNLELCPGKRILKKTNPSNPKGFTPILDIRKIRHFSRSNKCWMWSASKSHHRHRNTTTGPKDKESQRNVLVNWFESCCSENWSIQFSIWWVEHQCLFSLPWCIRNEN